MADDLQQAINVFTGINVYVNDKKLPDKNVNNNPNAFVYNGTIYVAAGTIIKALGQNASWDGDTNTLYIGSHNAADTQIPVQPQPQASKGGNLLDICPPYQTHNNYQVMESVTIAGKKYTNAFCLSNYSHQMFGDNNGWALYNLDNKYASFSFDIGHIDKKAMHNGTLKVYLDGNLVSTIDVTSEMLPKHYDINLNYTAQMKLEMTGCTGRCYAIFNATLR